MGKGNNNSDILPLWRFPNLFLRIIRLFVENIFYPRLVAMAIVCAVPTQLFAASIAWKVEHPFRYLRHASSLDIHQWALEELARENPEAARLAPISHLERKLNNPGWWKKKDRIARYKNARKADGLSQKIDETLRLGWGSFLTSSAISNRGDIDGTCWNGIRQRHSRCDESELHGTTGADVGLPGKRHIKRGKYMMPKFHRVEIRLDNIGGIEEDAICEWRSGAAIFLDPENEKGAERKEFSQNCHTPIKARLDYRPGSLPVTISVSLPDGTTVNLGLKVKDILIFALGDSYSSGEGNPEIPARLHPTRAIIASKKEAAFPGDLERREAFGVPRRSPAGGASSAVWTDRRCHRSIYSYQTRVALQLAIAADGNGDHHHAVTYFQYTCSGAEITEDILYPWEGHECVGAAKLVRRSGKNHRFYMPQISKASLQLCNFAGNPQSHNQVFSNIVGEQFKLNEDDDYLDYRANKASRLQNPRPDCKFRRDGKNIKADPVLRYCAPDNRGREIDLILSTAGGNDAGFSRIIANTIIKENIYDALKRSKVLRKLLKSYVLNKEGALRLIQEFLPHRMEMYNAALTKFLGDATGNSPPVVSMVYPGIAQKHDAQNNLVFCEGGNSVMDVSKFLSVNEDFLPVVNEVIEGQNGLVDIVKQKSVQFGWAVADGHRETFKPHGFCATRDAGVSDESGKGKAEIQGIPYKIVKRSFRRNRDVYSAPWRRYDPVTEFYPYESRQSWVRSPNQDFLNIHYFKDKMPDKWENKDKASAITLAKRIFGGSFHPTAEGHAHIADHVYCKSREVLYGETCEPEQVKHNAHP